MKTTNHTSQQNLTSHLPPNDSEVQNNLFSANATRQTINQKTRLASFERRFLSTCGKSENGILEIAMVWPDKNYVLGIHQYDFKPGLEIAVGSTPDCQYQINLPVERFVLAHCNSNHQWTLNHSCEMNGFILNGEKKTDFAQADYHTQIDKNIRAKYVFGQVSILVHYIDRTEFQSGYSNFYKSGQSIAKAAVKFHNYTALIASLLVHFAGLSIGLLAPGNVNALIVDRIMTNARFETVLIDQDPVVIEESQAAPVEGVDKEEGTDNVFDMDLMTEHAKPQSGSYPQPFGKLSDMQSASMPNSVHNLPNSANQAAIQAQSHGLLSQSQAMNNMLAAATDTSKLNLDWSNFDASAEATNPGMGLGMTSGAGLYGSTAFGTNGLKGLGNGLNHGYKPSLGLHVIGNNMCGGRGGCGVIKKGEARPGFKCGGGSRKIPCTDVTGQLDKRIVQKVIKQHIGEIKACYEREINKTPNSKEHPEGRVVVMWTISPQGSVVKALVKESTLHNKTIEDCVVNAVKYWRFPVAKGGGMTMVEYPFIFTVG